MPEQLKLSPAHRILGVFPHPDDEALAAGLLLQQAQAAGASVDLLFLTSGEANTWPLRVMERTFRVSPRHRQLFAARREQETQRALEVLGLPPRCARFWRWPDAQLTAQALADPRSLVEPLQRTLAELQPTHVVAPLLADRHPDHSTAAVLVLAASAKQPATLLGYAAHGPLRRRPEGARYLVLGSPQAVARKAAAIACHRSQLVFRRRFHLSFATDSEFFFPLAAQEPDPVLEAELVGTRLLVRYCLPFSWRGPRRPRLDLFWLGRKLRSVSVLLPWVAPKFTLLKPQPPEVKLSWRGGPLRGQLELLFGDPPSWVALRVHRPLLLFTESGFTLVSNACETGQQNENQLPIHGTG